MDEEMLITLVQRYRELYDNKDPGYDDLNKRNHAWKEIGRIMKQSAYNCKERWKCIRDNYRRAKKLRITKTSQGGKITKSPRHDQILQFLNPYLELGNREGRRSYRQNDEPRQDFLDTNISEGIRSPCSSVGSFQDNIKCLPVERKSSYSETQPETNLTPPVCDTYFEENYAPKPKSDRIIDFFLNMGETVKNFPEDVQIRVKREVFKIVNDAEELVYNNKVMDIKMECIKEEAPDYE